MRTDSKQYSLLCDLADGCAKSLPNAQLEQWEVDQEKGIFTATLIDGKILKADVRFLGTHDGYDFQWADSNISFNANLTITAKQLRERLPTELQELGKSNKLPITPRDTSVLTGLAASTCDCDLVVMVPSDRAQLAMALIDANFSDPLSESPVAKAGLFSRFFRKKPKVAQAASVADQLAALRETVDMAMTQWQKNLLSNAELRVLEPDLVRAYEALQANDAQSALDILSELQMLMGQFPQDQEPTGWIYLYEGIAATMLDDLPRARTALSVAARAIVPVPATVLRIAKARASEHWNVDHELKSAYLESPTRFLEIASPDEIAVVKTALNDATYLRCEETPEAVLHHAIRALYEVEISAHTRSMKAKEARVTANIMSTADIAARQETNKEYADILLKWATPNRSPELGSYSSNPSCDPNHIDDIKNLSSNDQVAEFIVTFKGQVSRTPSPVKYKLCKMIMPLTNEPNWRLDQITGGLDWDPYSLF